MSRRALARVSLAGLLAASLSACSVLVDFDRSRLADGAVDAGDAGDAGSDGGSDAGGGDAEGMGVAK